MFFDSWNGLFRVLVVGTSLYCVLVLVLRVSGKRTLSKMNAFDIIVTVALGSILASTITSKGVALAEGLLALTLLISLQFLIAWAAARSPMVDAVVKAKPAMMFYKGRFLEDEMRRERVSPNEVIAAIRAAGVGSIDGVEAVVLETSGEFTVVKRSENEEIDELLKNVRKTDRVG